MCRGCGVGFLGQGDAVVEGLEAFLDVFRRILEVEHEGILLARRGAVQAGERLHAGHAAELLVHIHRHQLGLIEARLELARHNEESVFIGLVAIPRRSLGEAVHLGFGVFLAVLGVLHHVGESHQRLGGAAHRVQTGTRAARLAFKRWPLLLARCRWRGGFGGGTRCRGSWWACRTWRRCRRRRRFRCLFASGSGRG